MNYRKGVTTRRLAKPDILTKAVLRGMTSKDAPKGVTRPIDFFPPKGK